MRKVLMMAGIALLMQGCASKVMDAPLAPCASAERDCGPAKPLNGSFALLMSPQPNGAT